MTRLLLDEMLSPAIAAQLEGADVRTVSADPELRGAPDDHVLSAASTEQRILVTANIKDFVPLAQAWTASGRVPPPIVLVGTKRFPMGAHRLARITSALRQRLHDDHWPGAGQWNSL